MLLDHFHPPLSKRRHWNPFLLSWTVNIAARLNEQLPDGWYAEPFVHSGTQVDSAEVEMTEIENPMSFELRNQWTPLEPALTVNFSFLEEFFAVYVIVESRKRSVIAAGIRLVARSNKDNRETGYAFVFDSERQLRGGGGLVIVDIVTDRDADLHEQLVRRFEPAATTEKSPLSASAYRLVGANANAKLEVWHEPLSIGCSLPTMPLYLYDGPMVPVDLATSYQQALKAVRIEPDPDFEHGD